MTIAVLNRAHYSSREFTAAVENWPDDSPIWPHLTSRAAKENFLRYILDDSFDRTDRRNYESFSNLCTGFAAQLYARYNDSSTRLSDESISRLLTRGVRTRRQGRNVPAKLRIPIFVASYPGHAFNAVFAEGGEGADGRFARPGLNNVYSYLFVEPQNDTVFGASSPLFLQRYIRIGIVSIARLTGYDRHYNFDAIVDFIRGGSGAISSHHLSRETRVAYNAIVPAIFIADDVLAWRRSVTSYPTLGEYVRSVMSRPRFGYSDADLLFVFRFLLMRRFRRTPGAPQELLTPQVLHELTGRSISSPSMPPLF